VVGAGEHGYWLGSYEIGKRRVFEQAIFPGAVVYDIGANVGFYTLLAAVTAGETGKVIAFEPSPRNVAYIQRHVQLNHLKNVRVFEAAVSDSMREAFFDFGASIATGHLADSGALKVRVVSLDALLAGGEIPPPDFIKVDVEGAEYEVLRGAKHLLERHRPTLFLDTHQREAHEPTVALLQALHYDLEILDGKPLAEAKELLARPAESKSTVH
jgi:FkbM family methyltransferase